MILKPKTITNFLCWSDATYWKEFITPLTRKHIFTSNNLFHCNKKNQTRNVYKLEQVTREIYFARIKFYRIFDNTWNKQSFCQKCFNEYSTGSKIAAIDILHLNLWQSYTSWDIFFINMYKFYIYKNILKTSLVFFWTSFQLMKICAPRDATEAKIFKVQRDKCNK